MRKDTGLMWWSVDMNRHMSSLALNNNQRAREMVLLCRTNAIQNSGTLDCCVDGMLLPSLKVKQLSAR